DSYDADGEASGPDLSPQITIAELEPFLPALTGRIVQMPPPFSAKKIHGRPAHELVRKKKPVDLKPVEVDVHEFHLTAADGPLVRFTVECGAGTYIRSLVHELGQKQGSGAHLAEIVRTAVGEFTLDQAVTVEELFSASKNGLLEKFVLPMERLLPEVPHARVLPIIEKRVRHGATFTLPLAQIQPGQTSLGQGATSQLDSGEWKPARLRVFSQQEKLIAIAEAVVPRTYRPIVVLDATP
ncbi:MAG: hypothetical protein HY046_04580, partial [Acidobacteria bacterium]|nr:hypothetical protein [Acidobacteriota bacterium]